jgi:hypothetical protein
MWVRVEVRKKQRSDHELLLTERWEVTARLERGRKMSLSNEHVNVITNSYVANKYAR